MKAVQIAQFGSPSMLAVKELADPAPGPGEIAIDVTHAAVGLIDVLLRRGQFKDVPGMAQPPLVPGLEVAGTVRALGQGVTGFVLGEKVVSMSSKGTGGYASVYIAQASLVVSIEGYNISPALAVAAVPNATMAYVALTRVAHLAKGETVLVHGALGGFSAAFSGVAKYLGASRVVGAVRTSKLAAATRTKLPYDRIVDSTELPGALGGETFDVVIDPVGGTVRDLSFAHLRPGSRLIVAGNASDDWDHEVRTNDLWLRSVTIAGFNAGAYIPMHPEVIRPAMEAALNVVASGMAAVEIDELTFSEAGVAHERMESRALDGRIVLTPGV